MLTLVALLAASATFAVLTMRELATQDRRHVALGLFGSLERERLILATASQVISAAERVERLDYFRSTLDRRAWTGTLVAVTPVGGSWRAWEFADGERWQVEQAGGPRHPVRLVVGAAGDDPVADVLAVHAYEPRGVDVDLNVRDARLVTPSA